MTDEPSSSAHLIRHRLGRLRRLVLIEFSGLAYEAMSRRAASDDVSRHVVINRAVLVYEDIRTGKLTVTRTGD